MRLKTVCTNQRGEDVLTGEALVMPSKVPVAYEEPRGPGNGGVCPVGAWTVGVGGPGHRHTRHARAFHLERLSGAGVTAAEKS